ncbi:MAG: ABC transporter substrate-binding protein [Chloroflexi bacterium]|nr:ABC transporter substrate-binding protein [Chloroflexota bacterium]
MLITNEGARKVFLLAVTTAVTLLLLASCAAPPAAPPPPTPSTSPAVGTQAPSPKPSAQLAPVRLAASTSGATETNYYVGLAKDIFKGEGLDLRIQIMKADVGVAALLSGEVEFNGSVGTILQAASRGAPVRTVMTIRAAPPWHVMTRPEIRSVADLKGKKIGVGTARAGPQFAMMKVLQKNGLDPNKDAVFLGLGGVTATRLGALKSGAVDALLESAPQHLLLKKEGFNELMKISDVLPEWPVGSLSTTIKKIKDSSDMVKGMIRATLKSMIWAKNNKSESVDILMKQLADLGMDRESMASAYDDAVSTYSKDGMMSDQGLVIEFATLKELGEKVEVPQAANLSDYSLLREVQKELNLR